MRRVARAFAVFVVAWPLLAWLAAEGLVVRSELVARADALVVLAGSSTYRERARRAAELYGEGRAPVVVLTDDGLRGGWSHAEQRNPFFYERAAEELRRRGVPAERIMVVPRPVSSTYEEAARVREFAEASGLRSVLVVTSAYQSRRALWSFRRAFRGSGVGVGLEAVPPGEQSPPAALWWLHRLGWEMVPGEYLKFIYYVWQY